MFCLKAANAKMLNVETVGLRLAGYLTSELEGSLVKPVS